MNKELIAKTNQKARMFDLLTSVSDLAQSGKRDMQEVADTLQVIKDHRDFAKRLGLPHARVSNTLQSKVEEWKTFYREVFGLDKDFSELKIPAQQEGFDRLIIVAQGMTPNRLYDKMKELMPARKYTDDLDSITSVRKADQDYAIWVRDLVEADEELKNKSADDLKREGVNAITFEERLLLELKYFKETNQHLDVDNITLCAGSRDLDGRVPDIRWFRGDGGVRVLWYDPDGADGALRARVVVS